MRAKIISAPPGVGKSYFCDYLSNVDDTQNIAWDTDSSKFKEDWPKTYCAHIKHSYDTARQFKSKNKDGVVYIFISNHLEVLNELKNMEIPYIVVYPNLELKDYIIHRIRTRKTNQNNESIANVCEKNFNIWMKEWENETNKIELRENYDSIYDAYMEGLI